MKDAMSIDHGLGAVPEYNVYYASVDLRHLLVDGIADDDLRCGLQPLICCHTLMGNDVVVLSLPRQF
jgi:hypothetical protein